MSELSQPVVKAAENVVEISSVSPQALLPEPVVPEFVCLADYPCMMIDVSRLKNSDTWILAEQNPMIAYAAMNLWLAAWHQTPAASLPANDHILARHACLSAEKWLEVKESVISGWTLCRDGRYYHKVVAEKALEAVVDRYRAALGGLGGKRADIDNEGLGRREQESKILRERIALAMSALQKIHPSSRVFKVSRNKRPDNKKGGKPARQTSDSTSNERGASEDAQPSLFGDDLPDASSGERKGPRPCPVTEIVNLYNRTLTTCTKAFTTDDTIKDKIRARWKEDPERQNMWFWFQYFNYIDQCCDKLTRRAPMGKDGKPFQAPAHWFFEKSNFPKILGGAYEDQEKTKRFDDNIDALRKRFSEEYKGRNPSSTSESRASDRFVDGEDQNHGFSMNGNETAGKPEELPGGSYGF